MYNAPYSANVKTNIVKIFLNLIKKHFPKTNKLHKIFNRNMVKISYSCMSNISSIILGNNKNLLNPTVSQYGCNCRVREECPLQNQCLMPIQLIHVLFYFHKISEVSPFTKGIVKLL